MKQPTYDRVHQSYNQWMSNDDIDTLRKSSWYYGKELEVKTFHRWNTQATAYNHNRNQLQYDLWFWAAYFGIRKHPLPNHNLKESAHKQCCFNGNIRRSIGNKFEETRPMRWSLLGGTRILLRIIWCMTSLAETITNWRYVHNPIGSMGLVYSPTIWLIFMVNVGIYIYIIHGSYGIRDSTGDVWK